MNNISIKKIDTNVLNTTSSDRYKEVRQLGDALKSLGSILKPKSELFRTSRPVGKNEFVSLQAAIREIRNSIKNIDGKYEQYRVSIALRASQQALLSKQGLQNSAMCNVYNDENKYVRIKECRKNLLDQIKHFRKGIKTPRTRSRTFGSGNKRIDVKTVAGCHIVPNEMVRFQGIRESYLIFDEKKPKGSEKHVGIELEFISATDQDALAVMFDKAGLSKHVTLKEDGSLRSEGDDYPHAHELCILALESEYKDIVKKVTIVLNEAESKINKSCGMHLHVDARTRNRETMFHNLVTAQSILYAMNPKSRRENSFAKRTTTKEFFASSGSRYWGVNPTAYDKHKTIEVRMHSGTIDYTKIVNWVEILVAVANKEDKVPRATSNVNSFCKTYGLSDSLKDYINERINKFADDAPVTVDEVA